MELSLPTKKGGIMARRKLKNPHKFKAPSTLQAAPDNNHLKLSLTSSVSSTSLDNNNTPTPPSELIPKVDQVTFESESERRRFEEFAFNKSKFLNTKQLKPEDFETIKPLGQGIGGVVHAVKHKPTCMILAQKMIHLDLKPKQREQIVRELKIMHECNSPNIVGFYGSFHFNSEIYVLMEYMDIGSLESVCLRVNRIPEDVCGHIVHKGFSGLKYLREEHKIIHRDVKPSNILVNSAGEVKLCDFGVSGELEESLLMSFVGTRFYMAPERLEGFKYAIQSDIWSFGLTLIEILTGAYPIPPPPTPLTKETMAPILKNPTQVRTKREKPISVFELLAYIVEGDPPTLSKGLGFSDQVIDFANICCKKDPKERTNYDTLLAHEWIRNCLAAPVNMKEWALSTLKAKAKK